MKLSHEHGSPAAVVLGCPVGSRICQVSRGGAVVKKVRSFHEALAYVGDPQIELYIARLSIGTCRVTHLLRTVNHVLASVSGQPFSRHYSRIAGVALSPEAWQQASLPVRSGGLGMTRSSAVAPSAALVSSALTNSKRLVCLLKRHCLLKISGLQPKHSLSKGARWRLCGSSRPFQELARSLPSELQGRQGVHGFGRRQWRAGFLCRVGIPDVGAGHSHSLVAGWRGSYKNKRQLSGCCDSCTARAKKLHKSNSL